MNFTSRRPLFLLISLHISVIIAAKATIDEACSLQGVIRDQNTEHLAQHDDDDMPDEACLLQQPVLGMRMHPSSERAPGQNPAPHATTALRSREPRNLTEPPVQLLPFGMFLLDGHATQRASTAYRVEFRAEVEVPSDIRNFLTIACSSAVLVSLAGCMWWGAYGLCSGARDRYQTILAAALLFEVVKMTSLSVIVPCSLDLTLHLGYDSLYSGILIGAGYVLTMVSSIFCRWMSLSWNQQQMRALMISMAITGLLSSLLYAIAAKPPVQIMNGTRLRMGLLMFSRLAAGLIQAAPLRMMMTRVTPGAVLATSSMYMYAAVSLGNGAGPLLSSLTSITLKVSDIEEKASCPLFVMAAIWALTAVIFWTCLPNDLTVLVLAKALTDNEDSMASKRSSELTDSRVCVHTGSMQQKARLWKLMTSYGLERAFAVSGLEAALPMLLEVELAYGTNDVGLFAGSAFVAAAPVSMIAFRMASHDYLGKVSSLPVLTALSTLSAVLLTKSALQKMGLGGFPLLLGSALIFAMGYAGNGISVELAMRYGVLNSWFNQDNFISLNQILQNTVGRAISPVLSRYLIALGGQDVYALLQLGFSLLMFICAVSAVILVSDMSKEERVQRL
mmetsp:Transcript_30777/g.56864  ORF Transcript_30777/g.56864 Transcript_30777/m.56864 type:complete len:618 (+) Transcript_30777:131-1984(+)